MTSKSKLYQLIYAVIREIPHGTVLTYGAVARLAGLPRGARQVGYALSVAPDNLPWHRVIGLSRPGYGRISIRDPLVQDVQQQMLEAEGIDFSPNGEIDLSQYQSPFL